LRQSISLNLTLDEPCLKNAMREKGVGQKRNSPPQPTRNADMLGFESGFLRK
jgi:hypothetical protein